MQTAYQVILTIHSIIRWLILLFGLFAIIRAVTGMNFRRPWEAMDDRAGLLFTIFLDVQVLLGLVLYIFLSPATRPIFQGQGVTSQVTLFFGIEHIIAMFVGVVLAHVGRSLSKKAGERAKKINEKPARDQARIASHRTAAIFYALALIAILLGIPWPFLPVIGRPLI